MAFTVYCLPWFDMVIIVECAPNHTDNLEMYALFGHAHFVSISLCLFL